MVPRWCWLLVLALVLDRAVAEDTSRKAPVPVPLPVPVVVTDNVTLTTSATLIAIGQPLTLTARASAGGVGCVFYEVPSGGGALPLVTCGSITVDASNIARCTVTKTQAGTVGYATQCQSPPTQAANGQAVKPLFSATSSIINVEWATPVLELRSDQSTQTTGSDVLLTATAYINSQACPAATEVCKKLALEDAQSGNVPVVGANVTFAIFSGTGTLTAVIPSGRNSPHTLANSVTVLTDSSGVAQAQTTSTTAGNLGIRATLATGSVTTAADYDVSITFTGGSTGGISKILLSPDFEEAHCGEVVRLVATALDASNNTVADTTICFFISGHPQLQHYHPELKRVCHVTDAVGSVALSFTSKLPGPLAVVAGGRNSDHIPVVSRASHVMFWGHDEHKEHHHHGGREGWWRNTEYSAAAIKQAIDGMAAAPATKALLP